MKGSPQTPKVLSCRTRHPHDATTMASAPEHGHRSFPRRYCGFSSPSTTYRDRSSRERPSPDAPGNGVGLRRWDERLPSGPNATHGAFATSTCSSRGMYPLHMSSTGSPKRRSDSEPGTRQRNADHGRDNTVEHARCALFTLLGTTDDLGAIDRRPRPCRLPGVRHRQARSGHRDSTTGERCAGFAVTGRDVRRSRAQDRWRTTLHLTASETTG